jgi:hypothetical protein
MNIKQFLAAVTLLALCACDAKRHQQEADNSGFPEIQSKKHPIEDPNRRSIERGGDVPITSLRSAEMLAVLGSPNPSWLTIGEPVRAVATPEPSNLIRSKNVWKRSGTEQIAINGKEVRIAGSAQAVTWASINPSGTRILIERGESAEVYTIAPDGSIKPSDFQIPRLNFGEKNRWFLTRWVWISESEILSALNEQTPDGDHIARSDLYYYNLAESKLSKVLLPDKFIDANDPHLEIVELAGRNMLLRTVTNERKETWVSIPN